MKTFRQMVLLLGLVSPLCVFGQDVVITYEFDSAGEIADWNLVAGSTQVKNSAMYLGVAGEDSLIELPFVFDRSAGDIRIEAVMSIKDADSEFNLLAFYDDDDPALNGGLSLNGYSFGFYPIYHGSGSDILAYSDDTVASVIAGGGLYPGWYTHVQADIASDGLLVNTIKDAAIDLGDDSHQFGKDK